MIEQMQHFYRDEFPVVEQPGPVQMRALEWILDNVKPGSSIFEFGCNSGPNLAYLEKLGYKVSGVDISREAVKRKQVAEIVLGDQTLLEAFADNSFNLVFTVSVLCHIPVDIQDKLRRIGKQALFVETTEISDINYFAHDYKGTEEFKILAPRGIWYKGYLND